MKINIYIYQKQKYPYNKYLLFKAYIDLKSWLIIPKVQLSAIQSFLILKVS